MSAHAISASPCTHRLSCILVQRAIGLIQKPYSNLLTVIIHHCALFASATPAPLPVHVMISTVMSASTPAQSTPAHTGRALKRNPSAQAQLAAGAAGPAAHVGSGIALEECDIQHISQRYPDLSGRVLQVRVFSDWRVGSPIHTPWLCINGARAMVRSAVNQERAMNATTLDEYTRKAIDTGLLEGLGSALWAIPDTVLVQVGVTIFQLLTGGTRVEAVYLALHQAPQNPQVLATIAALSPTIHMFSPETPRDVQEYLRDIGNSLNDFAVSVTWLETLCLMPTVLKLFESEKERRARAGLASWSMSALTKAAKEAKDAGTPGVLGYEATFYDFTSKLYPGRFGGIGEFQAAKLVHNKMTEHGGTILEDIKTWARASVMWTDRRMKPGTFFVAFAECFKLFEKHAPDLIDLVPLMCRFAAASSRESVMSSFIIQNKDDIKTLAKAFVVISDDKKALKRPGFSPTTTPIGGTSRPTLLLDEVIRTMTICLAGVPDSKISWEIYDNMLLTTMLYGMVGSVTAYVNDTAGGHLVKITDASAGAAVPPVVPSGGPGGNKHELATTPLAKAKTKRRSKGLAACSASAAGAAPLPPFGDQPDGADDADGSDDAADDNDFAPPPNTTAVKLNTHSKVLVFVAKQLCVTHKIKLKDVVFDNDDEDDANDDTAAPPAAPAQQQPDVVTTAVSDVESMISTIRQHEENKHTRVSSGLALFMKHHPDLLATDLIPLVHTAMTTASGILVSDDNKELISLGHAIGKLSSSQSAPDAGQAGQLKARVFGTCCNCTCPVCL